ncbi:MAG: MFS transporter [Dehalococcoidia bacterium]|nr:MFS transporter [Dehalococcoidia bacterium]MCB9486843.1 MFS transporter [Thermoflexaceae bacterium]
MNDGAQTATADRRSGRMAGVFDVLTGRRKVYYGWWLLAGAVVAMAVGSGVSFWSLTLYVEPLEREFGWSRAEVTGAISVSVGAAGLFGPLVGRWIDIRGPRTVILIGAVLTAASYLLMSTTSNLWQWYLYSSINSVFRTMMFFLPFQALISRFFDRKRGLALGILGTGFSLGGFLIVPLMAQLIDRFDWNGSFLGSGIIIIAIFMPIGFLLVKNTPADAGTFIDGDIPLDRTAPLATATGMRLGEAVRTPFFWVVALAVTLFFYGMFGWLVHQVPFYESVGMSTATGSLIVAMGAGLGIFTRLGFGIVVDRVASIELAGMVLAACLFGALGTLWLSTGPVAVGIFLAFWVVGAGGGPMLEALILTRAFGVAHFATIFGVFIVVETLGQVTSPVLAGYLYDRTGSYDVVLTMWMTTFCVASALFFVASRMPRPQWAGNPRGG